MNEETFKDLKHEYALSAVLLLDNGSYITAYHCAGLAAECALKEKVSAKIPAKTFPPKKTNDYYCHNINTLINLANLREEVDQEVRSKSGMGANIQTVRQWNVEDRYNTGIGETMASSMVSAVTDEKEGFITWLDTK